LDGGAWDGATYDGVTPAIELSSSAPATYGLFNDVFVQPAPGNPSGDEAAVAIDGTESQTVVMSGDAVQGEEDAVDAFGTFGLTLEHSTIYAGEDGTGISLGAEPGSPAATLSDDVVSSQDGGGYGLDATGLTVNADHDTVQGTSAAALVYALGGNTTLNVRDSLLEGKPVQTDWGLAAWLQTGNGYAARLNAVNSTLVSYGKGSHAGIELDGAAASTATASLANSIVWADDPTATASPSDVLAEGAGGTSAFTATTSSFTTEEVTSGATGTAPGTDGNFAGAPAFINPAAGLFQLAAGSALIDAGSPAAVLTGETDLDGRPRVDLTCNAAGRPDVGAYEHPSSQEPSCSTPSPTPPAPPSGVTSTAPAPPLQAPSQTPASLRISGRHRSHAKLSFTLNEAAAVQVEFKGHRTVHLKGRTGRNLDALSLSRRLRPGRYTITLVASSTGGHSKVVRLRFRVRR
jgi:hypothetical protein